ncbi:hypothetical protein GE061_001375 [Apolygus lucorum]|uniref:Uncharacterized protein n=1 Tax=Apolygus lucorum TaxID=248454 RepID=A0A6A4IJW6_APOLU|nr:hypothetical protein GE061_008846 [Apolygus lucorum]KAF6217022.1 hypothetical protein GE061_001375 [Apolygus lucorum]
MAAVFRLYKGSIIICLLIEGLYEWLDEKYTFFILYKKFNFLVKKLGFFYRTRRPYRTLFSFFINFIDKYKFIYFC